MQSFVSNASEVDNNKISYVEKIAASHGISTDALKDKAIDFIEQRAMIMEEVKHHTRVEQPTSINDLILVKKVDPNSFVDKFNEFLRKNNQEASTKENDFDFNYPMFLVPLDNN